VPLRVVKRGQSAVQSEPVAGKNDNLVTALEIVLPGGAVIRLKENSNVQLVAELLSALKG